MFGLTPLGLLHTAISLIAVLSGLLALLRDGAITWDRRVGQLYVAATLATCLTAFGIFQHGGFGKAHAAAVITLVVLALVAAVRWSGRFGSAARYVETIGYSFTFFVHLIPGITETVTRLPLGAPWVASPEDPGLQATLGVLFVAFLVGAALQVRQLRRTPPRGPMAVGYR